jgi:uncharacterized protein (TIGR02271 family)
MVTAALSQLDDYQLVNKDQDIRGWPVRDPAGQSLGKVKELMVDTDAERVAIIVLESGATYPVEDISLGDHAVVLGYGTTPTRGQAAGQAVQGDLGTAEARLPIIEERLRISKREVEQGGVRVHTRIEEQPVEEQVRLREEQISIERRPVDRPLTDADVQAAGAGAIEVRASAEEVVVAKEARVVEEVIISKEVGERSEIVRDTVRRTEVAVEEIEPGSAAPSRL